MSRVKSEGKPKRKAFDVLLDAADLPGADEHAHQSALFAWASGCELKEQLRWLHAIPNGGDRDRRTAGQMVAEGVKSGVWDVFLPTPRGRYMGLYIEMKRPGREKEVNGGLSATQLAFGEMAHNNGYRCIVCYHWRQAAEKLNEYLTL